jgi:alkylation response protein AidB-like acyl-CoA dehydrogenase
MELGLSPEQRQLQATVRSYLEVGRGPLEAGARWRDFAGKLGILGAGLPVALGGAGGVMETMVIMEELGAALALEPFLDSVVIAGLLFSLAGGREAELLRIASGTDRYAFAWMEPQTRYGYQPVGTRIVCEAGGWRLTGHKLVVEDARFATGLIVTARSRDDDGAEGGSLVLVNPSAPGIGLTHYPTIDGRHAADIAFDNVVLTPDAILGSAHEAASSIEHAGDLAVVALCAEGVGVLRAMLDATIAYTSQRQQFGRPLAEFQALQHRMVDMFLALERARSAVCLAALSLDEPREARARAASIAGVLVGEACRFVGENAIQLHGGTGMAEDASISRYFRRAMVIEGAFGTRDHHLARFMQVAQAA